MQYKITLPDNFNKLLIISKSKFNTYNFCPHAFLLGYIGEVPRAPSPVMEMGSRVHLFHQKFFENLEMTDDTMKYTGSFTNDNGNYEKNIVEHYKSRWQQLRLYPTEQRIQFFMPTFVEQEIVLPDKQLKGVPDALFEDPNLGYMTFELKTGVPNPDKIEHYKEDLIWYRILVENSCQYNGKSLNIEHGKLYFPINNLEITHKLHEHEASDLLKRIDAVREKIRSCCFDPTPTNSKCSRCGFRLVCEFNVLK
jgi:CRISPR/Cas system-associated exonuclease Cas4 (RecB family)